MTCWPFCRDSATFSAIWRQTAQRMNSAVPSFHSFVCLSKVRGVEATVKLATAAPEGVNLSSGSSVRLPTTVMTVSPAMAGPFGWIRVVRSSEPHGQDKREGLSTRGSYLTSGRVTLVRTTDSFSVSWRSSSLTVAGSAVRSMTA